jgi:hypothetical protein
MSGAVMDRGLKKVAAAIEADNAKEYQLAFNLYKEAMEILMIALKRASRVPSLSARDALAANRVPALTLRATTPYSARADRRYSRR